MQHILAPAGYGATHPTFRTATLGARGEGPTFSVGVI